MYRHPFFVFVFKYSTKQNRNLSKCFPLEPAQVPLVGNHCYMSGLVWETEADDIQDHPTHSKPVPTLYFRFSKERVDSSPTSFFLFSPTKRAATCAGRTFSKRRRFRFSHSSTSSLSARFLFFNRKS